MSATESQRRTITVENLARVEGEGALDIEIDDSALRAVRFRIFEPPRFFEGLLRGRPYADAPDITSRICGICPIAYNLGASLAIEDALGIRIDERIRRLRRLGYCGEWVQSHALHTILLHAPDFLGFEDAFAMAAKYPRIVESALDIKRAGNAIMEAVGGRAVHPVSMRVGGFYAAPDAAAIRALAAPLRRALGTTSDLLEFFARFDYPEMEVDYLLIALHDDTEYAIDRGRIASNDGWTIDPAEFEERFIEEQAPHSTALHGRLAGDVRTFLMGLLARYALNYDQLSPVAHDLARRVRLGPIVKNPYRSLLVRTVEIAYAFDEALRLIEAYAPPDPPFVAALPRAGRGTAATEAPRGLCYHRYDLDAAGRIAGANIVPPTSQNQRQIEADLRSVINEHIALPDAALRRLCEQTIRNYDPCISCATHAVRIAISRS
jgi:sulfhydrogenase subunit alpha